MKIATILFTYNRSEHTKQVLEGISKNSILPEKLYVFQDGLKAENHRNEWIKVKNIVASIDFCPVEYVQSDVNKGLAKSIVDGINYVFQTYDAVIVLEDDCVPAKSFFTFMNQSFDRYYNEKSVFAVSGYAWPINELKNDKLDAYFNGRISSWGWGTWKERWLEYSVDNEILLKLTSDVENSIRLARWGKDLPSMFCDRLKCKNDSWAVYWALEVIYKRGLCLCPYQSLIKNIGCDGTGVHCGEMDKHESSFDDRFHSVFRLPDDLRVRSEIVDEFQTVFGSKLVHGTKGNSEERIIVYGLGQKFSEKENDMYDRYNIIALCDLYREGYYAGYKIIKPEQIIKCDFDKIVITIEDNNIYESIRDNLCKQYGIDIKKIEQLK